MTNQLHDLLDQAAESAVRSDLATRAVVDARHRRRQRFAVGSSVMTVAAVVLGFVAVTQPFGGSDDRVAPVIATPLPAFLPTAANLPPLAEAPIEAASVAYIVNGEVVLVNGETGQAATAFATEEDIPPSLSGGSGADFSSELRIAEGWNAISLSPDGRSLLMTMPRASGFERPRGRPLYLLDVGSGDLTGLTDVNVVDDAGVSGSVQPQVLAWSTDSAQFACVCSVGPVLMGHSPELLTFRVSDIAEDGQVEPLDGRQFTPAQIAWGESGLFVQFDDHWFRDDRGFVDEPAVADTDLLAPSAAGADEFALVNNFFASSESNISPIASGPAWTIEIDDGSGTSAPKRPAFRSGTALAVTAVDGGYVVVVRPRDAEPGEPAASALDVAFVDSAANQSSLTRLPRGTIDASFAATIPTP